MSTSRAIPSPDLDEHSLHNIGDRAAPGDGGVADWARLQARQELAVVVRKIWRRANARSLDRGLTLSLPYFDDDAMEIRQREVEVIPRGRFMFLPGRWRRAKGRNTHTCMAPGKSACWRRWPSSVWTTLRPTSTPQARCCTRCTAMGWRDTALSRRRSSLWPTWCSACCICIPSGSSTRAADRTRPRCAALVEDPEG